MAKKSQGMAARHAAPKKSKRKPKQEMRSAPQFSPRPVHNGDEDSRPAATFNQPPTRARMRSTIRAISADYSYVVGDLKRIAIVSGALFAIMIILAFVVK